MKLYSCGKHKFKCDVREKVNFFLNHYPMSLKMYTWGVPYSIEEEKNCNIQVGQPSAVADVVGITRYIILIVNRTRT